MEPLSKPLTDWLLKLNLCRRADLRRCRGRVRQLARDVPAFDSVWIDALVHARKLTAFQARLLESGQPERLAVGPCVLVDQLGHGMSTTYLARHRDGNDRCVLKRINVPSEQRGPVLDALQQLVTRARKQPHPGVVTPKSCLVHQGELVTVSRYLEGPSLRQLLVRRGRFPARIVLALAKQIIDALAALEDCGLLHGDLRLENLRLASSGVVTLVDAGIAPVIRPELNIHARISPEHYDGIAPELIGTGNPSDTRSEFYALGCLLWQLLAGRSPFPTGDPLAKLMAHQTRRIPDVRDIAPDTPAELAEIVRVLTDPDPNQRPPSFRAFRSRWGAARRRHRRQVAGFRALFNTAIPHIPAMTPETAANYWPMAAALLFMLSGASLSLMDSGLQSKLLAIPGQFESYWNSSPDSSQAENPEEKHTTKSDENPGLPLPAPNAKGVIELSEAGPYRWSQIDAVGPLTIRGTAETVPVIIIDDAPCQFRAADVTLENLHFRKKNNAKPTNPASPHRSLLRVTSRTLTVRKCGFDLGGTGVQNTPPDRGIAWKHIDPNHPVKGQVSLENCLFSGAGNGCHFHLPPAEIEIKNCLKSGSGVLLDMKGFSKTAPPLRLSISQLTLRDASGLLHCDLGTDGNPSSWLVKADHCVFDLSPEGTAMFQATGTTADRFFERLQMQGQQCLLNDKAAVASRWNPLGKTFEPQDSSTLSVEGLVFARLEFAGPIRSNPEDSKLTTWHGPRFSSSLPGIDPDKLPRLKN